MSKQYLVLVDTVHWFLLVNHLVHLCYTNKHTHTQLLTTLVHGFSPYILGLGTKVFEGIQTFVGKPSNKSSNAFIN